MKKQASEKAHTSADNKKKLIIVIVSVLGIMALLFAASYAIDLYNDSKNKVGDEPIDYDFYPADFNENIFEDADYMMKIENGFIDYTDSSTNLTLGIERETASEHGKDVEFMVEYVYSIINGDLEKYNSFFSKDYPEDSKKQDRFTMQKLYDVVITKIGNGDVTDGGQSYTKYEFALEYKILENNGTFRNDIGSGARKQYITVSDKYGEFGIESITYVYIK
ncbi:MAG: hypothetical protein E7641_02520 [Ruminococcaceae bacterium]|nr:hypothetical protein [Oscillospiraceae bacterium]